jgi:hypothetical protein
VALSAAPVLHDREMQEHGKEASLVFTTASRKDRLAFSIRCQRSATCTACGRAYHEDSSPQPGHILPQHSQTIFSFLASSVSVVLVLFVSMCVPKKLVWLKKLRAGICFEPEAVRASFVGSRSRRVRPGIEGPLGVEGTLLAAPVRGALQKSITHPCLAPARSLIFLEQGGRCALSQLPSEACPWISTERN